jgi:hypothetical protein
MTASDTDTLVNGYYIISTSAGSTTEQALIGSSTGGAPTKGTLNLKISDYSITAPNSQVWHVTSLGSNKYTLTSFAQSNTENCLILGSSGSSTTPQLYNWNGSVTPRRYCGFTSSNVDNAATWTIEKIATGQYTIKNTYNSATKCLIFTDSGKSTSPSLYTWGGTNNTYCGLASAAAVITSGQANFKFYKLASD